MRRHQRTSPLAPDPRNKEDVMRPEPRHLAGGADRAVPAAADPNTAGYAQGRPAEDMLRRPIVQLAAALVTVTGLWVAVSPWFLTLQMPLPGNARANNLIIGLAIAAVGMLVIGRLRGLTGLPVVTALAGIWLIISPFILDAKFSITASMYWSNIWAGAVVIVASLAMLSADPIRATR